MRNYGTQSLASRQAVRPIRLPSMLGNDADNSDLTMRSGFSGRYHLGSRSHRYQTLTKTMRLTTAIVVDIVQIPSKFVNDYVEVCSLV